MMICKICVASRGYKLGDKDKEFASDDEIFNHLEDEHGTVVIRATETADKAIERCREKGITGDEDTCQCGDCKRQREEKNV